MTANPRPISDPTKFRDPALTAAGEPRAVVAFEKMSTLWFNTGTLCNLTCRNCYIESSPTNDKLVFISAAEVAAYLDEIDALGWGRLEIGFTGGEPFINPDLIDMLEMALDRGHSTLVLTNAMRPMMKCASGLLRLLALHGDRLVVRVSIDHYAPAIHEIERGPDSWPPAIQGLSWLARHGFTIRIAGRSLTGESVERLRQGYTRLFAAYDIPLDADNPEHLVIFPEMDEEADAPEISTACWSTLGVDPASIMCASSRMVAKRKGDPWPTVMPCTLLPYEPAFGSGRTLADSTKSIPLNHPHCSRFCVLGGGSCSSTSGEGHRRMSAPTAGPS